MEKIGNQRLKMKTFLEMSRDLDTQNVNKAIQHD